MQVGDYILGSEATGRRRQQPTNKHMVGKVIVVSTYPRCLPSFRVVGFIFPYASGRARKQRVRLFIRTASLMADLTLVTPTTHVLSRLSRANAVSLTFKEQTSPSVWTLNMWATRRTRINLLMFDISCVLHAHLGLDAHTKLNYLSGPHLLVCTPVCPEHPRRFPMTEGPKHLPAKVKVHDRTRQ